MGMKIAGLILILFAAAPVSAQTNQTALACRYPFRVFGNNVVNLTPLFQWWQQSAAATNSISATNAEAVVPAERPLAEWHRIIGLKAGELGGSWLVDAVIYTSPKVRTSARIILDNPPVAEEAIFNTLKQQLAQATRQITNDQRAYDNDLKAAQRADELAARYLYSGTKHATESYNNFVRAAAQDRAAAAITQNQQQQLQAAFPAVQKQLAAIPAKNGKYLIDWFALELGKSKQGVPIYDVGGVPPGSPQSAR